MRAWLNGELLDSPEIPALSVLDHGITVGDGVFETVAVVGGRPFAMTRHLERLKRSALGLGLDTPDVDAIRAGAEAVLAGGDLDLARMRITVTDGVGPLGSGRHSGPQTVIIICEPMEPSDETTAIITVEWARNDRGVLAGLKTTSYAENAVMVQRAHQEGASEAVMPNTRGQLCEGTGSNIFYVIDGEIFTPTLDSGCLAGITRALVLEWNDVTERDDTIDVLQRADEIFLAGTTRDVQGVHLVDRRQLPAPGPVTARVRKVWDERAAQDIDP